jgi:hypothetical protein
LGGVALACSGTSFTTGEGGGGSSAGGDESSGGILNRAGRNSGGTLGKGGKSAGGSDSGGTATAGSETGGTSSGGSGMGGDVSVGGDVVTAGTATGGNAGTSSGPPVDLVCPKSQPSNGALCKDGLTCSYGADLRVACRNMAKCDGGKWTVTKASCEGLHACADTVKDSVACDAQAPECIFDSSQVCVCTACNNNGLCSVDQYHWACAGGSGGPACPVIPPNLGQPCGGQPSCPYGSCAAGNNVTASCTNQSWSWEQNPCPLAAQ